MICTTYFLTFFSELIPPTGNKKYFYPYVGEGLRYEIKDFVVAILTDGYYFSKVSKEENLMMAEVQEIYILGKNVYKL